MTRAMRGWPTRLLGLLGVLVVVTPVNAQTPNQTPMTCEEAVKTFRILAENIAASRAQAELTHAATVARFRDIEQELITLKATRKAEEPKVFPGP